MNKYIVISTLLLSFNVLSADWLELLTESIGASSKWDFDKVTEIINSTLTQDISNEEKQVKKLEKKCKETENGFWGNLHAGEYKAEMSAINSSLNYHKKIIKTLENLNKNEKASEDFAKELNCLYTYETTLKALKDQYQSSKSWGTCLKLGSLISLEQSKIMAKRAKIKSSFFLFD